MKEQKNPFITTGYSGKEYFCDRVGETAALLKNITNGQSTTLTSIRRIGKTGLIRHVIANLPEGYTGVYLDILPTENINDFLNAFISAVFEQLPEKNLTGKKILEFIKSLRPVITYDPLTGQPQVTIDFKPGETEHHTRTLFRYLEEYPQKIVIAIDEFQQILTYPEKTTNAFLRSVVQNLQNVRFIFAGSQQHLMAQLFSDPAKPFYQSAVFMKIGKISRESYTEFISANINKDSERIGSAEINEILDWTNLHTYYVQLLCNRVFSSENEKIISETWKEEAARLLLENELIFFRYRDMLTGQQWNLLKALAHEEVTYSPTAKDFIARYNLGSPSTVLRSLESLQVKGLIFSDYDSSGTLFYSVYDLLFCRWIQRR